MTALRDLVGHEKIKASLVGAIVNNRVSHAYLFYGLPGVGKKTAGLAFARALLCRRGDGDACESCTDCARSQRAAHPDMHVVRPDGASIKIRQLREVRDGAVFTSFGEGRQVFLVEQADKMTTEAANSFLKTLEEPSGEVVFILVTDDPAGMPSTVLSRCQCYRFDTLAREDVVTVLSRQADGAAAQYETAAALSGGSPGRALELLNGTDGRDRALELVLRLSAGPNMVPVPPEEISDREKAQDFEGRESPSTNRKLRR